MLQHPLFIHMYMYLHSVRYYHDYYFLQKYIYLQVKIGSFQTKLYGVTGDVFIMDSQSFVIRNFKYSGEGPDGIITGGFSGEPNNNPDVIFSFPFSGEFSQHLEDGKSETIDRFDGQRDLLLTLPDGINAFQLKWISVWCRDFGVNFGHAILQHHDQYS